MTASDATYVVVMNGSALESERNLTGMNVDLEGVIVTNGTPCNNEVNIQAMYKISSATVELLYNGPSQEQPTTI